MSISNELSIVIEGHEIIHLPLPYNIHLLLGDSGKGKTYICKIIDNQREYGGKVGTTIPLDDILIWSKISDVDTTAREKLIIIDRYAYIRRHKQEVVEFIRNTSDSNKFILISNRLQKDGFEIPSQAVYELIYDEERECFTVSSYFSNQDYTVIKPIKSIDELFST